MFSAEPKNRISPGANSLEECETVFDFKLLWSRRVMLEESNQ